MPQIEDKSCRLIIADPPYFQTKGKFDFVWQSKSEWVEWCDKWIKECIRILTDDGTLIIWGIWQNISHLQVLIENNYDISLLNKVVWHYKNGQGTNKRLSTRYEEFLYYTNSSEYVFNLDDVRLPHECPDKRNNPLGKNPSDVWQINRYNGNDKRKVNHPNQKPDELCDRIIKLTSNENDTILIPFLGSGSECVSTVKLNRNFIGIEKEWDYCEIANKRIKQARELKV